MTSLKRTALSLFIIGLFNNQSTIAGTMGPVSVCDQTNLFIGINALYLQPRNDDLDYATVFTRRPTYTHNVDLDYDWGFNLFGGIKFYNNNDIKFAWQRLHTIDHDSIFPNEEFAVEPRWLPQASWTSVLGQARFDYDEVSGVIAHTSFFNNGWLIRYGIGAEYAEIDSRFLVDATTDVVTVNRGFTNTSVFHGVGPRIEGDVFYNLYNELNVFASANAALLIGSREFYLTAHRRSDASRYFDDRLTQVPKLGLRVGVDYKRPVGLLSAGKSAVIDFQVGWQAETYFDAIERPSTGVIGGEGSISTVLPRTSNYNNQGLFFGVALSTDCL
ncbi:major outer membrane protein [Legionella busanensis]|uniref:Major outer membrane protein n=1 Tax=Legionella busanensis TaxID=190655 RepID=A0A378JQB5_9GAMM|nr:Lpg1974 family pore-forming outer membrane protein [Legionella busanensis]STX52453.1 major outer membrane protein [Legionella busanensis]